MVRIYTVDPHSVIALLSTGHGIHGSDGPEHAERHAEERRGVQRPALHDGESEGGI